MNSNILYVLGLIGAVALQVLLFNHLPLFGGIVLVYVVALYKMPYSTDNVSQIIAIVTAFIVGLLIDICCNTHGMHSFTAITMMLFRNKLIELISGDRIQKDTRANSTSMSMQHYLRFSITLIAIYVVLLYFIEAFSLFNVVTTLTKVLMSTLLTWLFAVVWEFSTTKK